MRKPIEIKALKDSGEVEAVIATLNVIDKDGDVTLPGFFGTQETKMVWHHDWADWLGKGVISEEGEQAIFRGEFFLGIPSVDEAYQKVKRMGDLGEWSYGFMTYRGGRRPGTFEDRDVSYLAPLEDGSPGAKVYEVSPVLVGAGEGTRTRHIKTLDGPGGTVRFLDQLADTLEGVKATRARALEIADLRAEKGGTLGGDSLESIAEIASEVKELGEALALITQPETDGDLTADVAKALARFASLTHAAR